MARLPQPGGDSGNWGDILNDYLSQSHKADGAIKDNAVTANTLAPNSVTNTALASDSVNATTIVDGTISEALLTSAVQTKLNAPATITDGSITTEKITNFGLSPSAITGTAATVSQVSQGKAALTYGIHLRRSRQRLAAAQYRRMNITCIGNSITAGLWSTDTSTPGAPSGGGQSDNANVRQRGWLGQARVRLNTIIGTASPGEGVIQMADYRVSRSGGISVNSVGITRNNGGYRLTNSTGYVQIVVDAGNTECWIHGYWELDSKCPTSFTYTIDGGNAITATIGPLGSDKDWTFKIVGLSTGSARTIRIIGVDTKQLDISGFSVWVDASKGVALHRLALSGGYIDSVLYNMSDTGANPRSNRLTLGRPETDLLVLGFGANESSTSGEGVGWTPTRYESELRSIITYATGTFGCDVLLLSTARRGPSTISSFGEAPFYSLHETIASENSRVAHLDISRVWGDYSQASGDNLMFDTVHPGLIGHSHMAKLVVDTLIG